MWPFMYHLFFVAVTFVSAQTYASDCHWLNPQSFEIIHNLQLDDTQVDRLLQRYDSVSAEYALFHPANFSQVLAFKYFVYRIVTSGGIESEIRKLQPSGYLGIFSSNEDRAFSIFLNGEMDMVIDFVLENYQQRRRWPESFLKKIRVQAERDRFRSTLIIYRTLVSTIDSVRQIAGTLRIIKASKILKQNLPVDESLGIETPFNGDSKFELANFAISRQFNVEAFKEILIQLMMHAKDVQLESDHDADQMVYFTYADTESYRMYRSLGFTPLSEKYPAKEVDGVIFRPIGISSNGILQIPETMKRSRSYWDENGLSEVVDFFQILRGIGRPGQFLYKQYPAGAYFSGA